MRKRYVVFGLTAVLALSLAVPAFGGPMNPMANAASSALSIAKKALKKAKAAQNAANKAQGTANNALSTANTANTNATNAQNSANHAQSTANTALSTANTAETDATNANNNANSRLNGASLEIGTATADNATADKTSDAACPSNDVVTGGGYFLGGDVNQVTVVSQGKEFYANGWFAEGNAINGMTPTWDITATVQCGTF